MSGCLSLDARILVSSLLTMTQRIKKNNYLSPVLLIESQMDGSSSQNFFPIFSKIAWNDNIPTGIRTISRMWYVKYFSVTVVHLYSCIGIVHQDIQPAILLTFDPLKEFLNVFVICRIADNRHTFPTPLLYLYRERELFAHPLQWLAEIGQWILPCHIVHLQSSKFYLCSSLFQTLLLASCDIDGGSSLRELEGYSSANSSGGTCYHTNPSGQGHFLWGGGRNNTLNWAKSSTTLA